MNIEINLHRRRNRGEHPTYLASFRCRRDLRQSLKDQGVALTQAAEMGVALAVAGIRSVSIENGKIILGTHTHETDLKVAVDHGFGADSTSNSTRSR